MSMDRTFEVLNRTVSEGVISRYAIAGAVGALNYLEPMTTRDVDIRLRCRFGADTIRSADT
jgi:hypothetical protein